MANSIVEQLNKFEPKKHFIRLSGKESIKVVKKTGLRGLLNRIIRKFCPKQFKVQNVALRVLEKSSTIPALRNYLTNNPRHKQFFNKFPKDLTSKKVQEMGLTRKHSPHFQELSEQSRIIYTQYTTTLGFL